MILKIENRTYSYQGENTCAISATLNIYNDNGGGVIASRDLCASADLSQPDFVEQISLQIGEQISGYVAKLADLDRMRKEIFPDSVDFADAVDKVLDPIQTAIGG